MKKKKEKKNARKIRTKKTNKPIRKANYCQNTPFL